MMKLTVTFRNLVYAPNHDGLFPLNDKALFDRPQVKFCSQNLVTTCNATFNEDFSVLSDTKLADRRMTLSANNPVPLYHRLKAMHS
jgi:hypothetical protein